MKEIWKDIPGHDGMYQVSNFGRIRSWKAGNGSGKRRKAPKRLKTKTNHKGYEMVHLSSRAKRKDFSVHRLVAEAFIQNPDNKPEVNHISGVKENNRAENLEWCTSSENGRHAADLNLKARGEECGASKLTEGQVLKIRGLYETHDITYTDIGKKFGISRTHVARIIKRHNWRHI